MLKRDFTNKKILFKMFIIHLENNVSVII